MHQARRHQSSANGENGEVTNILNSIYLAESARAALRVAHERHKLLYMCGEI